MKPVIVTLMIGLILQTSSMGRENKPLATAQSNNAFGLELLKHLKGEKGKNQLVSPISAFSALSMIHSGAEGETQKEIARVLKTGNLSREEVDSGNSALLKALNRSQSVKTEIANSIWVSSRYSINQEYESRMSLNYRAAVQAEDFTSSEAIDNINRWAKSKTHGKIPQVVKELDPALEALVLNATYFKGNWAEIFVPSKTDTKFRLEDGSQVSAPFMVNEAEYHYVKLKGAEAVKLPYGEIVDKNKLLSHFNMLLVLPDQQSTLDGLVANLTPAAWQNIQTVLKEDSSLRYGKVEMPKFSYSAEIELKEVLATLGLNLTFSDSAELTGMVENERLKISQAFQKTFIKVDEEGTEAAAVTGVGVVAAGLPGQLEFDLVANRPFLIAIQDDATGAILFLGTVQNPNAQ